MTWRAAHAGIEPDGDQSGVVDPWRGWHDLVALCLERVEGAGSIDASTLGLLYVGEQLAADLPAILDHVVARTGTTRWVGAVAPAICAAGCDYFGGPGVAMMLADLPEDSVQLIRGDPDEAETLKTWAAQRHPMLGIVHGDPRDPALLTAVPELAATTGSFLVGGLTSASTGSQIAGNVSAGGLTGVLFSGDVAVATGLTQGCSPIGPVRTVTATDGEAIAALDDRSALDAFREDIGEVLARDLRRVGGYIHGAIPVSGSDTGDYLVRNLAAIDPVNGTVTIAAETSVGDQVMFVRRDAASAVEDMQRMLDTLKRRVGDAAIRGGVYHSCVARGPNQFGPGAREMTMIGETLGDFPLVGFFGNGEISHDRLYSYTGVLTLFLE